MAWLQTERWGFWQELGVGFQHVLSYSWPLISEAGLILALAAKNVNEGITAALAVRAVLPPTLYFRIS